MDARRLIFCIDKQTKREIEKTEIEKTEIEKTEIEKREIEKTEIEKTEMGLLRNVELFTVFTPTMSDSTAESMQIKLTNGQISAASARLTSFQYKDYNTQRVATGWLRIVYIILAVCVSFLVLIRQGHYLFTKFLIIILLMTYPLYIDPLVSFFHKVLKYIALTMPLNSYNVYKVTPENVAISTSSTPYPSNT